MVSLSISIEVFLDLKKSFKTNEIEKLESLNHLNQTKLAHHLLN
jgi:hypothetical protein